MKQEFAYLSKDGHTRIHAVEWIPEKEVKAVLQISHGMVEYIERYDAFASYLAERGYYVTGQDHLGHGKSVISDSELGYFGKSEGNACVIGDIETLRELTQKKYPDKPYFMLGHSMGSFLLRQYLKRYGEGLSGAIIMGTGYHSSAELYAGKTLCRIFSKIKGDHYRSQLVNRLAFGSYNKKFRPVRTEADWLSKDREIVDAYVKNKWCTFIFTVNAYENMFTGMLELTGKSGMSGIPKELPVFFVAGKDDPVGNFGKSVVKVYKEYQNLGMKDVSIKLYKDDRHEILNETDRYQVYEDLYRWMNQRF